jgi:hypothetical protein
MQYRHNAASIGPLDFMGPRITASGGRVISQIENFNHPTPTHPAGEGYSREPIRPHTESLP